MEEELREAIIVTINNMISATRDDWSKIFDKKSPYIVLLFKSLQYYETISRRKKGQDKVVMMELLARKREEILTGDTLPSIEELRKYLGNVREYFADRRQFEGYSVSGLAQEFFIRSDAQTEETKQWAILKAVDIINTREKAKEIERELFGEKQGKVLQKQRTREVS